MKMVKSLVALTNPYTTKGNPCHITKGKNKGKIASSYHEWGRRHPPIAIKAYSFQDILNKMINQ
jgi:hypothetical protein